MGAKKETYLFYLGHPAHYHNISRVIERLASKNHRIILVARGKDVLFDLIKGLPYEIIYLKPRSGSSKLALIGTILQREWIMLKLAVRFKPKLLVGTDIVITHIGKLLGIPSFVLNEDDAKEVPFLAKFGFAFATKVISPNSCNISPYEQNKIGYEGYHELAYLHPNYFTPNDDKVKNLYENQEQYFILRFASLTAHHDDGIDGINDELAKKIIQILERKGKVWITSERKLSPEFEKYRIEISPKEIHHAMYYASLYVGDSQTMAAEAAVLGTPSIRFNDFVGKLGYLEELEHKYQLTFGFPTNNENDLLEKVQEVVDNPESKTIWDNRKKLMLDKTIDVTRFWTDIFDNYPISLENIKEKKD